MLVYTFVYDIIIYKGDIMFKIEKLIINDYDEFRVMFLDYFINDCGVEYDKDKLKENLINKTILSQYETGLIFIDIAKQDKKCLGFIIYQIDQEESDWKERIGSGFIREFYINSKYRNQGLGSKLLNHAEQNLKKLGVKDIYLTSQEKDETKMFYIKNGYTTNHSKAKNQEEYFEKKL